MKYKIYHLEYMENDLLFFKRFSTKKELDKFIKQIPKKLRHFKVFCNRYIASSKISQLQHQVSMTHLYLKEEFQRFILK